MSTQTKSVDVDVHLDAMELTEGSEHSLTGSIFDTGGTVLDRVLHWKRHWVSQFLGLVFLAIDVIAITVIYMGMVLLWYDGPVWEMMSQKVHLILVATSVISVYLIGGYEYHENKRSFRFACEHIIVSGIVFILAFFLIYAVSFYGQSFNTARMTVIVPLFAFPAFSIFYRNRVSRMHDKLRRENSICIIGSGVEARDAYRRIRSNDSGQTIFVVDLDKNSLGKRLIQYETNSPIIGSLKDLDFSSSMSGKFVESYIITGKGGMPKDFVKYLAVAQFGGNRIYTYESFLSQVLKIVPPSQLTLEWAFSDGFRLNRNLTYSRIKRLSDIFAALIGLIVLSPVFVLTALAVRLTSKGPIIFSQSRIGEKEKPFTMYKFRSMKVGSEKGNKYTQVGDSRITSIGGFLRKSRLDELPQLWNVLRGDLALIGPRAEWDKLVKDYEKKFPYYHFRHAVKPGITGWAQVNYSYGANDRDTIEKLYYDLYYVRHFSFVLDLQVCIKTVYMMLFGKGM
ncbi:sugar transferase [Puniceicoccaceae bacterium K14]|nr:sugar transferase [Puniceicoccaceae bacterium K14]